MLRHTRPLLAAAVVAVVAGPAAIAQDEAAETTRLERFLERSLSTPERTVRFRGISGVLTGTVRIEAVTIADADGAWMEIDDVTVTWNRLALFRRVVDIDDLSAAAVRWLRRPAPGASAETETETEPVSLPVSVDIDRLSLPRIDLAAPVVGVAAALSAEASAHIDSRTIATELSVTRTDGPGGTLSADLALDPAGNALTARLSLQEPQGGLVARWLRLPGEPAVALSLDGAGPLADWSGDLRLEADGAPVLAGRFGVAGADGGYRIEGDVTGALGGFVPAEYRSLLAGDSRLVFEALSRSGGGLDVSSARLTTDGVALQASGSFTADFFPRRAELSLALGGGGAAITVPFLPGTPEVAALRLDARIDEGAPAPWSARLSAERLAFGAGRVARLILQASGRAAEVSLPESRSSDFEIAGEAQGIDVADPRLAAAVGETLALSGRGRWRAGAAADVEALELTGGGAAARFTGSASGRRIDGRFGLSAADLSRFAALAGLPLAGSAEIEANGFIEPARRTASLVLDGSATSFGSGIAALDRLIGDNVTLAGTVGWDEGTLRLRDLALAGSGTELRLDGSAAAAALDLAATASVADLSRFNPRARGRAALSARLTGTAAAPRVEATATGEDVVLMGRALTAPELRFSGLAAGPQAGGAVSLSARLGGVPVAGAAVLATTPDGGRRLDGLRLSAGRTTVAGDLALGRDGLLAGRLALRSPDIAEAAPLVLAEAAGALDLTLDLAAAEGRQAARFAGTARNLVYEGIHVGAAELRGAAQDLFGVPAVDADVTARDVVAGGLRAVAVRGSARRDGGGTEFSLDADLVDGSLRLAGGLAPQSGAVAVRLDEFGFRRVGLEAALARPTRILVAEGAAEFRDFELRAGGGRIAVDGRAGGERMALEVRIADLPAALADSVSPGLGARGTISGTASVAGASARPDARFDLRWLGAELQATREAGLGPLSVALAGRAAGGTLSLSGRAAGGGLALTVAGDIATAEARALDLKVAGTLPLALANPRLAERGAVLRGTARLDLTVRGTAAAPAISGRVTARDAGFTDAATGVALRDVALDARIAGDRLRVDALSARSVAGGTLSARGSIGIAAAAGYPLDLAFALREARYEDGSLFAARFDADLTVTGSLAAGPIVGGVLRVARAEITVPEKLPRGAVALDVLHRHAPPEVARTLARARRQQGESSGSGAAGAVFDLIVEAPARIFVRGRGLDAELGGRLALQGPVSDLRTDGAFELRRGRLDIFTRRLVFERGTLTFAGDLDPVLDFSGTVAAGEVTVTVVVTGVASDPEVAFSSVPELPEDEVLAYLLFGRGVGQLSPVQLARLAAAAAQFAGIGSGPGILERLRAATGLDDLDVVADEQGGVSLRAGRYLSDNLYLGLEQGTGAESSRVTVDLDIGRDFKARGEVGADGRSKIGVYFEKEY